MFLFGQYLFLRLSFGVATGKQEKKKVVYSCHVQSFSKKCNITIIRSPPPQLQVNYKDSALTPNFSK